MDEKNIDRLESVMNISMMFMKAAQEVREQEAEREERMRVRAAEVARRNREEAESKAVYEEYRRVNGYTAEEQETAREEFLEALKECGIVDNRVISYQVTVSYYDRGYLGFEGDIIITIDPEIRPICSDKIPNNYVSAEHPEHKQDITYTGTSTDYYYFPDKGAAETFIKGMREKIKSAYLNRN